MARRKVWSSPRRALHRLWGWVLCRLGEHDWTALAMEEPGFVPRRLHPEAGDSKEELMRKFREYATMYCSRCRRRSKVTP